MSETPFHAPCANHKNIKAYIVPDVPQGSDCFGCYMDAVKSRVARESAVAALEKAKEELTREGEHQAVYVIDRLIARERKEQG